MADVGAAAAQTYREHMRAKAERLGGGVDATNVDASSFEPGEKLYAGVKTGMRPVSRQARADGGAVSGGHAVPTPGRAGRKMGGDAGEGYINRNNKTADEDREGHYPNGGMRKGGRAGRAAGGYISQASGPSEDRALKTKTASSAIDKDTRPAAEDGRSGRAAGGRTARADGGPLATPLAAGMGGQGRMNFNFAPNRATAFKDGGRAKAHERYGHGPSCSCSSCRKGKADGGGLGALGGLIPLAIGELAGGGDRDDDKPAYAPGAPKQSGGGVGQPSARHPMPKSGSRANTLAEAKKRADGGKVGEGAVKQHRLEHSAMGLAKGGTADRTIMRQQTRRRHAFKLPPDDTDEDVERAKGGRTPPLDFGVNQAAHEAKQKEWRAQAAARKAEREQPYFSEATKARLAGKPAEDGMNKGGRAGRAHGGKAKGRTNINIIIGHPGGMNALPPPGPNPALAIKPPPAAMPMPMPPGPGAGAPPPAAMPMPMPVPMGAGPPGGMPPRARGGRAPPAGAGSGLGRLEKIKAYGRRSREGEGR